MPNNKRILEIQLLLEKEFGVSGWEVAKPEQGLSKETYITKNRTTSVFIKFNVNIPPLLRLNDLGLTPKVIATGVFHHKNFVIQEFVQGTHPDRVWFTSHIEQLADFIKSYHTDEQLIKLLGDPTKFSLQKQIASDLKNIARQIKKVNSDLFATKIFATSFSKLKKQSKTFSNLMPVAIHADPNRNNVLVTNNKIYMIDWDTVLLSDPLRDIGLILWWYVPKSQWNLFFKYYGLDLNVSVYNRVYWWAALRSLAISLWFLDIKKEKKQVKNYLKDFYRAVNKKENLNLN